MSIGVIILSWLGRKYCNKSPVIIIQFCLKENKNTFHFSTGKTLIWNFKLINQFSSISELRRSCGWNANEMKTKKKMKNLKKTQVKWKTKKNISDNGDMSDAKN